MSNVEETEVDNFKPIFKYFKSKSTVLNYDKVIDPEEDINHKITKHNVPNILPREKTNKLGFKNLQDLKLCSFKSHPGLILLRNPFTCTGQRHWMKKCLSEYPRQPNRTNLRTCGLDLKDWWHYAHSHNDGKDILRKLRWTTLGYHHNWDTKVYSESEHDTFPEELSELCDVIASILGFDGFMPQAAIVNYYHMDSTLSAHTDHSEVNLDAPLFSISFGQAAIFLIGGETKSIEPSAILIRSGDIVVMSKQARLCYHAVPRILPSTDKPWNCIYEEKDVADPNTEEAKKSKCTFKYIGNVDALDDEFDSCQKEDYWEPYDRYIASARININVRQVLNNDEKSLPS